MKVKPKQVVSQKITGVGESHSRTLLKTRDVIDVSNEPEERGVTLQEEIDLPYPEIRLVIELTTKATDEELTPLKQDLRRFCPVSKVISQSGSAIIEDWKVTRP